MPRAQSEAHMDAIWINEHYEITLSGLAEQSGLTAGELNELVESGVLHPRHAGTAQQQWTFDAHCLVSVRSASRLRDDFELDHNGVAVAISLLERIRALEQALGELRARGSVLKE